MRFKLIPRLKPNIEFREIFAALNIFKRNCIFEFENKFASKFKNKYGVMFSHGRVGLYSLFKVWNLENIEVICPAYTCVVVPHAIVLSGNIPVFVDCTQDSFNMNIEEIEKSITSKTRVIIATHLFGYPMDVNKIQKIVEKSEIKFGHKIYVIQDVAHSFGCKWENELVTKFGDASLFGLNISKTITSISGGIITTNSKETYESLITYRNSNFIKISFLRKIFKFIYLLSTKFAFNSYIYNLVNYLEQKKLINRFVKYYDDDKIYFPNDWNTHPTNMQARVGMVQLDKYEKIINSRINNSQKWFNKNFSDKIEFQKHIEGATYSHCVGIVENRDVWVKKYKKKEIQLGILIEYSIPYMKSYMKFVTKEYPKSLYYSSHLINFPNHKK